MTKINVTITMMILISTMLGCGQLIGTVVDLDEPSNPITGTWQVDIDTGEVIIRPTPPQQEEHYDNDLFVGIWEWIIIDGIPAHLLVDTSQGDTVQLLWYFNADDTWELEVIVNSQVLAIEHGTYFVNGDNYIMISETDEHIFERGELFEGLWHKEGDRLILTDDFGGEIVLVKI